MEDQQNIEENNEKPAEKAKIDEKTTIIVQNPTLEARNERVQNTVQKILTARVIRKEEKKTSLIATNNINEIDLNTLLSKDDNDFYQEKKRFYLEAYPELTDPFDLDDLHQMIMEQVLQRNMLKRKKKHPGSDIETQYAASLKRQNDLKKSLAMRRTDRVKIGETKKPTVNIANLSVVFSNPDQLDIKTQKMLEESQEEEELKNRNGKVVE